jgi:DNA-binding Lrp family transcriptional regulator
MEDEPELNRLDYRIISSLSRDARKPIEEIALEIKASSATVKRRLDRMLEKNIINMAVEWHPSNSDMLVPQFHLRLRPGTDKARLAGELMNRTGGRMLFFAAFGNLPDFAYCVVWGRTSREIEEMADRARKVEGVASLTINNVIREYEFETWRDEMVRKKAAAGIGPRQS